MKLSSLFSAAIAGAALLATAGAAPAQSELAASTLRSPFRPIDDQIAPAGSARVSFDGSEWSAFDALHAAGDVVALTDFVLPGGRSVDLVLRPISAFAAGAAAVVVREDGDHALAPSVRCFTGTVEGEGGTAFLAVSRGLLNGYLEIAGETWFLSSAGSANGAWIAHQAAIPGGGLLKDFCRVLESPPVPEDSTGRQDASVARVRVLDMFMEIDNQMRQVFGSDQDAIDYFATLATAIGEIWRRDLGVVLNIPNGYMRLWTVTPPWGVVNDFNGLTPFRDWWDSANNPDRNIPRAGVHLFTNPVFGGVAWLPAVCSFTYGYALSSLNGFFPYPIHHLDGANWDLFVTGHEWGHNLGSPHTFDYVPPIDCNDGSGPDGGTIMSYCHGNGMQTVGMRYHARVQEVIRSTVTSSGCKRLVTLTKGDYDMDGVLTNADLVAMISCRNQGFFSAGCLETMDMDNDDDLDDCDYRLLEIGVRGYELTLSHDQLLLRGQSATFTVTGANSGERVHFLYGLNGVGCGDCYSQIGGACLEVMAPVKRIGSALATPAGVAALTINIPNNAPIIEIFTQAVAIRGFGGAGSAKSNTSSAFILP
ncbi:MAG TPA: M12 family metallo-peptidase [Planctomycetota bacterium]